MRVSLAELLERLWNLGTLELSVDVRSRGRYAVCMRIVLGIPAWLLRASAQMLLVALSVSALGPVAHGVHEDGCEPAFVFHDEHAHHFQAAQPDTDGPWGVEDHCVACHFARSSRGPVSWEPSGLMALDSGVLLYHSDGELTATPSASPLPARAPPRHL